MIGNIIGTTGKVIESEQLWKHVLGFQTHFHPTFGSASARHCSNKILSFSTPSKWLFSRSSSRWATNHTIGDSKNTISLVPNVKTRWSPRTRMLTRMLMVQMSKHMVMQSRTIPSCNSLFEQSCACFPCYQWAVWSGKCTVWSVECEVRSVECKVWSGECRVCKV